MAASARTARFDDRRLASPAVRGIIGRRLAELGAVGLAVIGMGLLLALASWHPTDPSPDTATAAAAANLLGRPGAAIADVLLQWCGLAAALPGVATLAWAWRIGSRRGLGSVVLRVCCLIAAMPVLAASLSATPMLLAPGRAAAQSWPAGAGLGGAIGRLAAGNGLAAGRDMMGQAGGAIVTVLVAALAGVLTVLALGLSRREWAAAGNAARGVAVGGSRAAAMSGRIGAGLGTAGVRLLDRLNGVRREAPPNVVQPEPLRRETPREPEAAPWREAPPARIAPRVTAAAARRQPAPQQEALPLEAAPGASRRCRCWPRPPRGRRSGRPRRRRCRPMRGCWKACWPITACRAASWKSAPARW